MDRCWQAVCRVEKRLFVGIVVCKLGLLPSVVFGDTGEVVSVGEEFGIDGVGSR